MSLIAFILGWFIGSSYAAPEPVDPCIEQGGHYEPHEYVLIDDKKVSWSDLPDGSRMALLMATSGVEYLCKGANKE